MADQPRRFQFRIRDLLVFTAVVAVGLLALKWLMPKPGVEKPKTFAEASTHAGSTFDDPHYTYVLTAVHGQESQGWSMAGSTNYCAGTRQWLHRHIEVPAMDGEYEMTWYEGDEGGVILHAFAIRPRGDEFDHTLGTPETIHAAFARAPQWRIVRTAKDDPTAAKTK